MEWREISRGAFQSVRRYFVDRKKEEWREGLVGVMRNMCFKGRWWREGGEARKLNV